MRTREILLITLLFILSFMVTEIIVSYFISIGALKRFILRIAFLVQYSMLIYLLFDSRDNVRRLQQLESNIQKTEEKSFTEESKETKEG